MKNVIVDYIPFNITPDRKSVVQGKSVDLGGRRIIKKKKKRKERKREREKKRKKNREREREMVDQSREGVMGMVIVVS